MNNNCALGSKPSTSRMILKESGRSNWWSKSTPGPALKAKWSMNLWHLGLEMSRLFSVSGRADVKMKPTNSKPVYSTCSQKYILLPFQHSWWEVMVEVKAMCNTDWHFFLFLWLNLYEIQQKHSVSLDFFQIYMSLGRWSRLSTHSVFHTHVFDWSLGCSWVKC